MLKYLLALGLCMCLRTIIAQESGESETVKFAYDYHTHMLIVSRQAICYIFVLTTDERALVHTDSGMRHLELKALAQLNDPNLNLTTVPHDALHTNILKECGRSTVRHYIIQ